MVKLIFALLLSMVVTTIICFPLFVLWMGMFGILSLFSDLSSP